MKLSWIVLATLAATVVRGVPEDLPSLHPIVFRVPSVARLTGGTPSVQCFELAAWVAWREDLRFDGTAPPSDAGELGRVAGVLSELVRAYHDGDLDRVLALYAPTAQAEVRARLEDQKARATWLAAVRQVVSLTPLVFWQEGDERICLLRQETRDPSGTVHPGLTALKLDESARLLSGHIDSQAFLAFSNGLASPQRRVRDLVANVEYLEKIGRR